MARKRDNARLFFLPVRLADESWCLDCPAIRRESNSRDCYYCRMTGEVIEEFGIGVRGELCPLLDSIYTEVKQ